MKKKSQDKKRQILYKLGRKMLRERLPEGDKDCPRVGEKIMWKKWRKREKEKIEIVEDEQLLQEISRQATCCTMNLTQEQEQATRSLCTHL